MLVNVFVFYYQIQLLNWQTNSGNEELIYSSYIPPLHYEHAKQ